RIDLLAHGARVTDDPAGPVEHPLALGREALEARAPLHQEHAEHILELLDAGREGGLAHTASLGCGAEVALARQRNDEFELVEHESASSTSCHFRNIAGQGPEARHYAARALGQEVLYSHPRTAYPKTYLTGRCQ